MKGYNIFKHKTLSVFQVTTSAVLKGFQIKFCDESRRIIGVSFKSFNLPLRSWREAKQFPAGHFPELNNFHQLVLPGVQIKIYQCPSIVRKIINSQREKKRILIFAKKKKLSPLENFQRSFFGSENKD